MPGILALRLLYGSTVNGSNMRKARHRRAADVASAAGRELRIGFVPLADAAPLVVAGALGYFDRAGLRVRLEPELGWGSVRDRVAYGELDATHAPAGLICALLLGTHTLPRQVFADLVLNTRGNAITLSQDLWKKGVRDRKTFRLMVRSQSPKKPVIAIPSTHSTHYHLLRLWVESAGLDPDRDVRVAVLPPPLVAEHLRERLIDGFCVGEPWNSDVALAGSGWVAATSGTLASNHPEKVLLVSSGGRAGNPEEYEVLRQAIVEACRYCDEAANRGRVAEILFESGYFRVSIEALRSALVGPMHRGGDLPPTFESPIEFFRNDTNRMTGEKAAWLIESVAGTGALHLNDGDRARCLAALVDRGAGAEDGLRHSSRKRPIARASSAGPSFHCPCIAL